MSDVETIWQELLTSAFLGTDRHPLVLSASTGALADLLSQLDGSDSSHLLLQGAAVVNQYRQVGHLPEKLPSNTLPPCEPEERVRCSEAAAGRLTTMLDGEYKELLPEWLSLAASTQKRVPEEHLPDLLNWGEAHPDLVEDLLPVIGNRGRWLANQGPWGENVMAAILAEAASDESASDMWQTGRKAFRHMLIRRLRKTNPELALKLLESTWSEESVEDRAPFLKAFETGLSMADEPFLEKALDDRNKEVRKAAAESLAHLAKSGLVGRQFERAQTFLKWKPGGFLRKAQIEVSLPDSCDKDMLRDGIELKRSGKSFGEKAHWLYQILETIPPSNWSSLWGKSPSELLEIAGDGEWKELLHESWISATSKYRDPDWAESILKIYPRRAQCLEALPADQRESFLIAQIKFRPREAMEMLEGYRHPWGKEITRLGLPHLHNYFMSYNDDFARFATIRASFQMFGHFMDPAMSGEITNKLLNISDPGSDWEKGVEKLLKILDFRHQMMEELR